MDYYLNVYHLNGTFLGMKPLGEELFLCSHSSNDVS
jgi:hypothetical protein